MVHSVELNWQTPKSYTTAFSNVSGCFLPNCVSVHLCLCYNTTSNNNLIYYESHIQNILLLRDSQNTTLIKHEYIKCT